MKRPIRMISAVIAAAAAFTMTAADISAVGIGENGAGGAPVCTDEYYYYFFDDSFYDGYETFSTSLKPKFKAEATSEGVLLTFDYVDNASFYRIYKYDSKKKKFMKLDDTYFTSYLDGDVNSDTAYAYAVCVYQTDGKTEKKSKMSSKVKVRTGLMPVKMSASVTDKKIYLNWKKDEKADGYEIYYYKTTRKKSDKEGTTSYNFFTGESVSYAESDSSLRFAEQKAKFKPLKRTSADSLAIKRDKDCKYYFKIRTYQLKNGKRKYSEFSDMLPASRLDAVFNGVKGKSKSTVDVISYRSDVKPWTMAISESDRKIFREFEKEHFTSGMSSYEKAEYVAQYIHYNVDYAYGDDLNKLSGSSCAEAVFKKHSGQCYQYNGALAEFLAYMGYDVKLVSGYRGTGFDNRWNHFWCEITIDGTKYVLDAGNKKDGLYYFLASYDNTTKYLTDQ